MADIAFNTTAGQTIERELLIAYLNTGSGSSPTWSPLGSRVEDSSEEIDWGDETVTDILGITRTSMKKPTITQTFDPIKLDSGDAAAVKIWNLAFKDHDYVALAAQDILIVHLYADKTSGSTTTLFGERYSACAIKPTGLGGEGGGDISMPVDITYGGNRQTGSVTMTGGTPSFTADT